MSSANTSTGFFNIPPQLITTTSATELVVPAFTYNSGSPLPSPAQAAGTPLYVQVPPDIAVGSSDWDGHPFRVRVAGKINCQVANTFTVQLSLGNSTTLSAISTSGTSASITGATNFLFDTTFMWDSTSGLLDCTASGQINGVVIALASGTQTASVAQNGLIFVPFFTFHTTANALNSVAVTELTIDRV
jgi:hypothetical protein